jgi:hypothetical protein
MDVLSPQVLTVPLGTSVGPNTLLIMTGTVHMQLPILEARDDDNITRQSFSLDLSDVYGNRMFNPLTTTAVAGASLATMKGTSDADTMTWGVD